MTTIGAVTERISTWNPSRVQEPSTFKYIDLSAVDNDLKAIVAATQVVSAEAPSRARQIVATGDVLVSTVRPNLNAVAVVPPDLDGATASTGFTVLRPTDDVFGRYLFHWVRSDAFVADMVRKATGASYPAVSDRIIKESQFPLPPFDEQRRIAAILDQVDDIRAKRRQVLAGLDTLVESTFQSMFDGEPTGAVVEGVAEPARDSIRTGPFGSQLLHSEFVDEGIAVLGLDNVVANEFRWAGRRFITRKKYEQLARYTVRPGDVLISIMGTTGRCVVVPDDIPTAINTKHICAISVDRERVTPDFLRAAFLWHPESRAHLLRQTKGSIMSGLNMGIIKSMPVPLPPLHRQITFSERAAAIEAQRRRSLQAQTADGDLFSSLQSRAFRGGL